MAIYKEGQGALTRILTILLIGLVGAYTGISWYRWQIDAETVKTGSFVSLFLNPAFVGALVIFVGLILLGVYLSYFKANSADFLIELDAELRKVVWPTAMPLFDPKAEAWGSTYVVIVTTVLSTVYIGLVDMFFEWSLARHVLVWLLANNN